MRKITKAIVVSLLILVCGFFCFVIKNVPFSTIQELPSNITVSKTDLENLNDKSFGNLVKTKLCGTMETSNEGNCNLKLDIKLFGLISLKKIDVEVKAISVWAGGETVGFSLNSKGVIVIGSSEVLTREGSIDTLKGSDIKSGDVIIKLDGEQVYRVSDLNNIINKTDEIKDEVEIVLLRKGKELTTKVKPAKDLQTQTYKLGLWVKDDISGVGTLTYVRKDNYRFGALGHAICDSETKEPFQINSGDMYKCTVIGLNKATKGKPGEIKALFVQGSNNIGEVDKNTKYGIFGKYKEEKIKNLEKNEVLNAGGRWTTKPGKAKIRVNLGSETKDYDIEIIKTNYQNTSSDKSMVIRVTDKELLKKTGGIVQGMSGSPIIQDGKVIGAVTHVFVSDPTKGFGIYLDWMINE